MNNKDKALHDLICNTLRSEHFSNVSAKDIAAFNYKLGVALHNIPDYLTKTGAVPLENYFLINELDPSGSKTQWGEWCNQFSSTIEQDLPHRHAV